MLSRARSQRSSGSATPGCGKLLRCSALTNAEAAGIDTEPQQRGRYGVFHSLESWRNFMTQAGFTELSHYYRPAGLPGAQQPWLASVWRKASAAGT